MTLRNTMKREEFAENGFLHRRHGPFPRLRYKKRESAEMAASTGG